MLFVFLGCFFRSYLVTAAYNTQGLQNIGFLYAIEPALQALHGTGKNLRDARMRYACHYSCHPFFTPLLLGFFLHMERIIAREKGDPALLLALKNTTANALSAIGDSFFSGSLVCFFSLAAGNLVLLDMPGVALAFILTGFVALQALRFACFVLGLRKGMNIVFFLHNLDLINWGDRTKTLNALLLALFLWMVLPAELPALAWGAGALCLWLIWWIVGKKNHSRVLVALLLLVLVAVANNPEVHARLSNLFFPLTYL